MDHLMEGMGSGPNLAIKRLVSIGTMLNLDGDGHGHGNGTCKRAFTEDYVSFIAS